MQDNEKYFLGLDIGTTSVGWAVTDENYTPLKKKGQKLLGVRLFESANTAVDRRTKRGQRRRLFRKKLENKWLCELFYKEIAKVDENFFIRLKNSAYWAEDKDEILENSHFSIFDGTLNGGSFTDKDYYKKYPTIAHLRQELLTTPAKDIRLLFLALRNILKYRGHFYNDVASNLDETETKTISQHFLNINEKLNNLFEVKTIEFEKISNETEQKIINLFYGKDTKELENEIEKQEASTTNGKKQTKSFLKENMKKHLNVKDKLLISISDSICSGTLYLSELKKALEIDAKEPSKIEFNEENFATQLQEFVDAGASCECEELIEVIRQTYEALQLKSLLGNNAYVCEAMVARYDTHQEQLKPFKNFIKKYYPSKYNEIFRFVHFNKEKQSNYVLYCNNNVIKDKRFVLGLDEKGGKAKFDRSATGFYAYITSILNQNPEIEIDENFEKEKAKITYLMEINNFLPKPHSTQNSVFPNSLLINEAKKILKTNATKFEFLNEKDANGTTVAEKIIEILKFRVPYYVGPIKGFSNEKDFDNVWTKQNSNEKLTPWNFKQIVDLDNAEEEFIKRMTNKCTYIFDADVLPDASLLYCKYKVLNELNSLRINGERIKDSAIKQAIYNNLFKKEKVVNDKKIRSFLSQNFPQAYPEEIMKTAILGGFGNEKKGIQNREFLSNLSPYIQISKILGKDIETEDEIKFSEDVILYNTILSDKQNILNRLNKNIKELKYPSLSISEEQLKQIKNLNFASKWGRFSKEFLNLRVSNIKTGENTSIIDILWETQQNLEEIFKHYNVDKVIQEQTGLEFEENCKLTYEDVKNLYCSPSVKRGIWQAIQVVQEIEEIFGHPAEKIFVEVTRAEDENKKVSVKRQQQLIDKYNEALKKPVDASTKSELISSKEDIEKKSSIDFQLNDKLVLYYQQMCKCPYCDDEIEFNKLYKTDYCDIDHIVPQSIIKDDSFNNRVLAHKNCNESKSNNYPISSNTRATQQGKWKLWKDLGLITTEKYEKLTRTTEFTPDELANFVARDLVITNQSVKAVTDLLTKCYKNTEICFSKAELVSEFRNKYKIYKCRETNNFHHARDAYLNIVVGNVFNEKWTKERKNWGTKKQEEINENNEINEQQPEYTKKQQLYFRLKMFDKQVVGQKGQIVWEGEKSLDFVDGQCKDNHIIVTHRANYPKENGKFYDETLYKSIKHQTKVCKVPINSLAKIEQKAKSPLCNYEKYGGFNSAGIAYYMVIESDDKPEKLNKKGEVISKETRKTTIECVPFYIIKKTNGNKQEILNFVLNENNLTNKNPKILIEQLVPRCTLQIGTGKFLITGKAGDKFKLQNINELHFSRDQEDYIKNGLHKFRSLLIKQASKQKDDENFIKELENNQKFITDSDEYIVLNKTTINAINDKKIDINLEPNKIIQKLSRKQNELLFNFFLKATEKPIYSHCSAIKTIKQTMENSFEKFKLATLTKQATVLLELLNWFSGKKREINMSLDENSKKEKNKPSQTGTIVLGKNITNKDIKLIKQSVTGLKHKTIVLSKQVKNGV